MDEQSNEHDDKSFIKEWWTKFKGLWYYYRGWKWLIFIGMSLALLMSTYLVIIAKTTSVSTLQEGLMSTTTVYDIDDDPAGTLAAQQGTYVTLDQISPQMRETVVTVEDKRFYEHNGFDTIGIGRAFVRLLINRDTSGGGGSTLTQQLAKNAFLTLDQTFQRKFKELFLALEIEKQYTKDEILEMYLNHSYFGNGVWGVEDASWKYFGHAANSLDYNESMVLTGMLKGPSLFNPIDDYDAAIDRRNVVATVMENEGKISAEDADYIRQLSIPLYDGYVSTDSHEYPFYFDAVINEAVNLANIPEADLLSKGYRIYTNLNVNYQWSIDSAYENNSWLFNDDGTGEPLVQSASVVVDPSTGGVMAVYGGRGDYVYRGFNRATDMYRSPGSTIKPLAVYTTALEKGYQVRSMVPDVVQGYGSDNYAPENYDRQTDPEGEVPLYYALAQSKNTSAVYLMDEFGVNESVKKLNQFGIQVAEEDQSLTLALGAMSQGVSPLQLANAYASFANRGVRIESYFIRYIEDAQGNVVYDNRRPNKHMVMTPNVAADMTSMMLDTYGGYGTGYGAGPDYGYLAGKTGSTEVSEGNMETRDRWMVGYTPDFVIVTWSGLDNVDDGSLDELMPTGMGQLFNIQTTNLMANSPQSSFNVTYASQMEIATNDVEDTDWGERMNNFLDQSAIWLEEAWQGIQSVGSDLWNTATDFINQLN
ncbi:transglycosylase domain-containing protein [Fundicoccus culcitae]|uniref:PBP1A family penicillin-binding protein n=1 Tax=Fundicoccus culcitae TaxID=2969821 RepID=A0ABY5P5B0_9LACT|nr:PBP1A family penicillin-binding protein [Fundicoccus culcitae]UUX33937.1 PBP1A family penicillin-binding protein [Fundicoccus culcitae]